MNDPIVDESLDAIQYLGFAGLRVNLKFFAHLCAELGDAS